MLAQILLCLIQYRIAAYPLDAVWQRMWLARFCRSLLWSESLILGGWSPTRKLSRNGVRVLEADFWTGWTLTRVRLQSA